MAAVHCQASVAVGALGTEATVMTEHGRGKAATIEKNQYLLLIVNRLANSIQGRGGNATLHLFRP